MKAHTTQSSSKFSVIIKYALSFLALLLCTSSIKAAPQSSTVSSSNVTYIGLDTATQGNWQGKYGTDGYAIANSNQALPSYGSFAPLNQLNWTWAGSTTDPRAPQTVAPAGRVASTWYSSTAFSLDVNLMDGKSHQVAVYALDWDDYQGGRAETVQVVDANTNTVLDTRSISAFTNGMYLVWNITGHVRINVTNNISGNAVISGIFFGGATTSSTNAALSSFVGLDMATQGNWQGEYGADGYAIANSNQALPSYASFAPLNQLNWTWAGSTTDPRDLQTVTPPARIASTWYSSSEFSLDVNLTDGKSHQVAVYALDWDDYQGGRAETVQVVDANSNAVLDTRSVSAFTNGMYLVWNITGHVRINAIMTSGGNSVISGVFFGSAGQTAVGVAVAPAITNQPVSQTVTSGQSATFFVANTGSAPLAYQWMKNGAAITGATGSSYTTSATIGSNSGSQFSVSVSNAAGTAVSNAAILTVATPTLILTPSASSVNFGTVTQSSNDAQTLTLTNTGTGVVTISSVSVSGAGFNASGIPSGTILSPGQAASLTATFSPASTGGVFGNISVASNATNGAVVITLSGTSTASVSHSVALSWSPSTSSVVGYNVYVSTVSGSGYQRVTSAPVPTVSYVDGGLETAQTRYYVVTSIDSNNDESAYSSQVSAIVP
jgi:hypothetical protein